MARLAHLVVAAVSGFTILVLEFAAVRLMAPAFGQSSYVWANVIGVILLALTVGYRVGGRLGARSRSGKPLYLAYGAVSLWVLLTAFVGPALCAALVPTGLPSEGGLPLGFLGSLVAAFLLFVPPTLLLAMTSPFLIRLGARRGHEGATTGAIYAMGTLGSLAGCYLAPLWMLQVWGTRLTLLACAALAATLCLGGLLATRGGRSDALAEVRTPAEGAAPRLPLVLTLVSLLTGWAVTVVEFGAVRFMSPWFGQSNHVWANIIGLILLSLALGSWIGGRWADTALRRGEHGGRSLYGALGVAALALALAACIGPSLFEMLVPAGIDSLRILPVAHQGSKAAVLMLFAFPMILLGVTPPFLVRMATTQGHAGGVAGAVFAWTTVGGLVGCFTTSSLLVPATGSRGALLLAALVTSALGLVCLPRRSRGGRLGPAWFTAAAGVLVCGGLLTYQLVERPALRTHPGQVAEIESGYQTIRVVRERLIVGAPESDETLIPALLPQGQKADTIFLRHDEDAETYQSVLLEKDHERRAWLTGGRYFEHMAVGAFFAPTTTPAGGLVAPTRDKPLRVMIIGYAGGTVHRTLRQIYGGALDVLGIEIDPAVITAARDHLRHRELERPRAEHPKDRLRLLTNEDARTVVNALPAEERFDLILVDAYARTNYVPFQLATREFFEKVERHLTPTGWVGVNVLGHGFRGPVAKAVAHTMDHVYGGCFAAPNPAYPGNVILWARPGATFGPRLWSDEALKAVGPVHPGMRYAAFALERYLVRYNPTVDGGIVLTDDRSPSDRLADKELGL